ncbi:MAG: DUF4261 domain-containing protein [Lachnoclostridium sp.]|nr:DUF4261 domain-containing protein [Lachnoclostridium sp.]MCM1382973.1 DUF4261 domain-containing protein [Lachnoclostridium sp.]
MDASVRPGGVFIMHLLMKETCAMPSQERMAEVLTKHLGTVEATIGSGGVSCGYAAMNYIAEFKDGKLPVQLMISDCSEFSTDKIDEMQRSQMWDCREERDRILSECRYHVLAHDMLGGGLAPKVRANMLMDYLEALLELYPSCEAVYFFNSGKLILADEIRKKEMEGIDRFIKYAVNVRFFNIQGTEDSVIDTLGLSLLYIEDIQYHFHGMDPNWVVDHAYNMASYLLENNAPMKDGDTIDGIAEGRIVQNIQWKCHFEGAMIKPDRAVLDVHMGEFAAGNRGA